MFYIFDPFIFFYEVLEHLFWRCSSLETFGIFLSSIAVGITALLLAFVLSFVVSPHIPFCWIINAHTFPASAHLAVLQRHLACEGM